MQLNQLKQIIKKRNKRFYDLILFIINPPIILIIPNSAGKNGIPVFCIGILAFCGSPYVVTVMVFVVTKLSPREFPDEPLPLLPLSP